MRLRHSTNGIDLRRSSSGFSLVEMMVVVTIIGILAAMAVPSYQRAVEESRSDVAAANLRAVWAAQRLYWIEYHVYTLEMTTLRAMGLLDPEVILSTTGYTYSITAADNDSFQAVATRNSGTTWTGEYAINEAGQISGTISAAGQADIVPGFQ